MLLSILHLSEISLLQTRDSLQRWTNIQATRAMMNSTKSLRIMSHVEDKGLRTMALPSWVSGYSASCKTVPLDWGADFSVTHRTYVPFDASLGHTFNMREPVDTSTSLRVSCWHYGIIDAVGDYNHMGLSTMEPVLNAVPNLPQHRLWRTLIRNHCEQG